jgi:hypothetical protein
LKWLAALALARCLLDQTCCLALKLNCEIFY